MASEKRFAEMRRLLKRDGYELVRTRGSHHTFSKPGARIVVVPVHQGKVKAHYVRQIEKDIGGAGN